MKKSFFLVFIIFIFSSFNCTPDDKTQPCPFKEIKIRSKTQSDSSTLEMSIKLSSAIRGKKILDAKGAAEIVGSLNDVVNQYEGTPIDTVFAQKYNSKINLMCGLLELANTSTDPKSKQDYFEKLNQLLDELSRMTTIFVVEKNKRDCDSHFNHHLNSLRLPVRSSLLEEYQKQTINFLELCKTEPNCAACMDNVIIQYRQTISH